MKVFISWSGEKSRDVAQAFRDWLPLVLHSVDPFMSSKDIGVGTRWQAEVASELDATDFGLICVTRQNISAAWLNFEAGALAKAVDSSRVVPIAVDLSTAEVPNPLGQFQASTLKKSDVETTLRSINEVSATPISDDNLAKTFEKWWSDLEKAIEEIHGTNYAGEQQPAPPERSERDMLEEVLDSVRGLGRDVGDRAPRNRPRTPKLFDDIQLVARKNEAQLLSIMNLGESFDVQFRDEPSASLLQDLRLLEELSGEKIKPIFSPDPADGDIPTKPPT